MITDAADFCRYSRTRADMWIGTLSAAAIGTFVSGALGAYAAAAVLGKSGNPFVIIAGVSTSYLTLALILVFIAFDNWTINVLNLYTGGLSISNIFERLGRFWTTLIASLVGIALSAIPDVLNSYLSYATLLGNVFSPIAGVLVFDYLILKRTQLDLSRRCSSPWTGRYRYWGGVQPDRDRLDGSRLPVLHVRRAGDVDPGFGHFGGHRRRLLGDDGVAGASPR